MPPNATVYRPGQRKPAEPLCQAHRLQQPHTEAGQKGGEENGKELPGNVALREIECFL